MILYPNAKINIGLNILNKRADGFHELETLMYPVKIKDTLIINKAQDRYKKPKLTTDGITIDGNTDDNLIVKAYNILDNLYNLPPIDFHLHKTIPFGAGLGGGSADCAFTITGINELCNLNLTIVEMENIASQLGSDCPFFITNKPAISTGRGEILNQNKIDLNSFYFAVIIPPIPISTKEAYNLVTPNKPIYNLEKALKTDINKWKGLIVNNFEDSVFPQYPAIKKIKEKLYNSGAKYSSLSGSGSAVFGIFKERPILNDIFPKDYFVWLS